MTSQIPGQANKMGNLIIIMRTAIIYQKSYSAYFYRMDRKRQTNNGISSAAVQSICKHNDCRDSASPYCKSLYSHYLPLDATTFPGKNNRAWFSRSPTKGILTFTHASICTNHLSIKSTGHLADLPRLPSICFIHTPFLLLL